MRKMSQRTYRRGPFWIIPLVFGLAVLFMPFYVPDAGFLRMVVSIAFLSMLVVGLNITFGYAGELALGQSAIYAVGAYGAGILAVKGLDLPVTLVVAIIAGAAVGLLTGIPGIRLGSWSLGMVTFFLVLLIPDVVNLFPAVTGSATGLAGIPLPAFFGAQLSNTAYFMLVIGVAIIFFILLRNYVTSRHGTALKVMRESPVLARSLGYSVPRLKLSAYVIGALPAGAAGALFAYQDGYISPGSFGFQMAVAILAASIIGGSESIYGAILGAAILVIGPLRATGFQQFSLVFFGVLLVAGGLFFSGGIAGILRRLIRRYFVNDNLLPDVQAAIAAPQLVTEIAGKDLVVTGVVKSFGGNRALGGVDLVAKAGQVTALIGPNGSGKTTLLNIISGFYATDEGTITVGDRSIVGLKSHQIARVGVSRTFQTPLVPKSMTAAEVVESARYARSRSTALSAMLTLPGARGARRRDREEALRLLSTMGIVELADRFASDLPLGTRRILEVARALAGDPAVVLLDEPASGLDENEVKALSAVIVKLRDAGATIVIVEHNFEMVMSIADSVNVLHLGKMIATGAPEQVRNDPQVVESYLGKAAREQLERDQAGGAK
jgi:branched-chain amino acid transport system permease protein